MSSDSEKYYYVMSRESGRYLGTRADGSLFMTQRPSLRNAYRGGAELDKRMKLNPDFVLIEAMDASWK